MTLSNPPSPALHNNADDETRSVQLLESPRYPPDELMRMRSSVRSAGRASMQSVQFADKVEVRRLDTQLEGIDVRNRSSLDIKRVLFDRFFDETSLPLFAPTSPRNTHKSPKLSTSINPFAPRLIRSASSTISRTTANTMLHHRATPSSSPIPKDQRSRHMRQHSPQRSTTYKIDPTSPAGASKDALPAARLSGALHRQPVPHSCKRELQQLHQAAITWSEAQVRHQCSRGLVGHVAALMQVPGLQQQACTMLAALGERWPAALAGAAAAVAQHLPLPLARSRALEAALQLLQALAACGQQGRQAVSGSPQLMEQLALLLREALVCVRQSRGSPIRGTASKSCVGTDRRTQLLPSDEAWGPGLLATSGHVLVVQPHSSASPFSSWLPDGAQVGGDVDSTLVLDNAMRAAKVLLHLLPHHEVATEVCRLHPKIVDPVCRLFLLLAKEQVAAGCIAAEFDRQQGQQGEGPGNGEQCAGLLKLLMGCMLHFSAVPAACHRMVSPKVHAAVPHLLHLLTPPESSASDPLPRKPHSGIPACALRCLAAIAGQADSETRGTLRDALDGDSAAVVALVQLLRGRPVRVGAATRAALLLWVASNGDNLFKKEELVIKHQTIGAVAELMEVTLGNCCAGSLEVQHTADAGSDEDSGTEAGLKEVHASGPASGMSSCHSHSQDAAEVMGKAGNGSEESVVPIHELASPQSQVAAVVDGQEVAAPGSPMPAPCTDSFDTHDLEGALLSPLARVNPMEMPSPAGSSTAAPMQYDTSTTTLQQNAVGAASGLKLPRTRRYGRLHVEALLINCLGLTSSLLALLVSGWERRDAAAKAVAPAAAAVARAAAECVTAGMEGQGEGGSGGGWSLEVKEKALAVLSNMCLHEQLAVVSAAKAAAPAVALQVVAAALKNMPQPKLQSSPAAKSKGRMVMWGPSALLTQAASLLGNHLRVVPGILSAEAAKHLTSQAAVPLPTAAAAVEAAGRDSAAGQGVAPRVWELQAAEGLDLMSQALLILHSSLLAPPTSRPSPVSPLASPVKGAVTKLATAPSHAQLSQLQAVTSAMAGFARAAAHPDTSQSYAASVIVGQAALALAELLSLGLSQAAGSSEVAASARHACAVTLWSLLSCGLVHPDLEGLVDRLLLSLPSMLRQGKPATALLLLGEVCRSTRGATRIVCNTAAAKALLVLYFGRGGTEILPLLERLRKFDRYNALRPVFEKPEDDDLEAAELPPSEGLPVPEDVQRSDE